MGTENPKQNTDNSNNQPDDLQTIGNILGDYVPIDGDPAAEKAIKTLNYRALGVAKQIAERKFDAIVTDRTAEMNETEAERKTVNGHEPDPEKDDPNL